MGKTVALDPDNFEAEVIKSETPVLVDFWADWCMPCKMIAPALDELARDLDGKLKVGKVNVDQQPDLATQYGIVSIPTLMVFHKGEMVKQHIGLAPKHVLAKMVDPYLS